jgi:hypothetical protein
MKCRGCGEEKPDEAFALRSDKGYRRRTCNDCMNQRQGQRQANYRAERRAWKERTKWGAKGGKAAAARGDWLRNMAPAAKARYIRDANLKALYGISLSNTSSCWNSRVASAPSAVALHVAGLFSTSTMTTLRGSSAACSAEIAIGPSGSWTTILTSSTKLKPIFCNSTHSYLTKLMILNRGIYRAITIPPTAAPMTAIRMGSIRLVSEATAASTSWS